MNNEELIRKGLEIATQTKSYVIGKNILGQVPEVYNKHFSGKKALVVADDNTWKAAGEEVYNHMIAAGIDTETFLFPDKEFHAEWKYVEMLDEQLKASGRIAVSVGSGVINDLCKLSSFHQNNQRYLSVATAASVDGYSSFGASITYQNAKQTFDCPAPIALMADTVVLANAPKEMTAAGYADLAAKVPAGAEWMIADLVGTEPIIPDAWHVLQDVLDDLLSNPQGVADGDPDAIADLFNGLTLSGFAMQAAQSSRPASCCDHLYSHIMDMTHHRYHGKLQSHGFQVAVGTLTMCAVFEEFLKMDFSQLDVDKCVANWPSLEEEQERAKVLFEDFPSPELGYTQITQKYNDAETVRKQLIAFKENWPAFREKIKAQVYPYSKMKELFRIVGAPTEPEHVGVTRKYLLYRTDFVQLMRWRFNIYDLAKRGMFYDELVHATFDRMGTLAF